MKFFRIIVFLLSFSVWSFPSTTYQLKEGWNLVGSAEDISNVNLTFENITTIWKYNDNQWYVSSPDGTMTNTIESSNLQTFSSLKKTDGFWVNCPYDMNITIEESEDNTSINEENNNSLVVNDDYSNTLSGSKSIEFNTQYTGSLETSDDIDYFSFILTEETTVEFTRQSNLGSVGVSDTFYFKVYNSSNQLLLDEYSNSSETDSLTLASGTYYVKIYTFGNDITGYQFTLNTN